MRFNAHCPAYVDGFSKPPVEGTLADILADPWVASWAADDFGVRDGKPFTRKWYRWSLSDNHLMAEWDDGQYWWVVGYLTPPPVDELPVFAPVYHARLSDGREVFLRDGEVSSSCAGMLWLRDGTEAHNLNY